MKKTENRNMTGKAGWRRAGKAVLRTVLFLFLFLLFAVLIMWMLPLAERVDETPVEGSADWMGKLPDDLPLSSISIPGTHDAGTACAQYAIFARCQARGIAEQLDDGFRYLDIRLALTERNGETALTLKHSIAFCRETYFPFAGPLYLDSVLADCYAFLDAHPAETVLFVVDRESRNDRTADVQNALASYIEKDAGYWYSGSGDGSLPTLGEVRGKLVLLRRFGDDAELGLCGGIQFSWGDQGGYSDPAVSFSDGGSFLGDAELYVEDRYCYSVREKENAYYSEPENAGADDLCVRFLSTKGHGSVGHPYYYAKKLNPILLKKSPLPGWTIVDFGNAAIAESVYSLNFGH